MLNALRHITWWQTLILCLCLFGCFVAALGLWLRTDHDLGAIDARARTLGLPVSVADISFAAVDEARLADWKRLLALAATTKPWSETPGASNWVPMPGAATPAGLIEHHATLPADDEIDDNKGHPHFSGLTHSS